jgi:hypothetical protein
VLRHRQCLCGSAVCGALLRGSSLLRGSVPRASSRTAETQRCFAARSRAGLHGARSTRAQTHRHAHMPRPPVWHAGVKNVRPVALPGFRASAQEDRAEGLAADLSRRSALAVRAPHVFPHAVLSLSSRHLMPPSLPRLSLRSHRDDRPSPHHFFRPSACFRLVPWPLSRRRPKVSRLCARQCVERACVRERERASVHVYKSAHTVV